MSYNSDSATTVDNEEVAKFTKIADQWWDKEGKFKPLHKFNPARLTYIKENLIQHFKLDQNAAEPLKSLKILDIGCGGGLLCEPLAKLGAKLYGIDAGKANIEAAKVHAKKSELSIDYQNINIENLAKKKGKFDVVLAMEVVEHVANVENFIAAAASCLKKDGLMFIATINRTLKSYMLAIIGAEYILRWLPAGTHSWSKFLKPSQIYQIASENSLKLEKLNGFEYNLLNDRWKVTNDNSVNYIAIFKK